ncbi:hypothetical protein B7R22_14010 [Subtercola boreus]|uniref:HTH tetR-type domain-containing protein n=1 Tax=Subtercola boreus TaxID=120213 RepID=A0A3E0VTP6_9MICO|nr:TetR/AcrR family transcriptional regulator [Subtercola boreus]RFA13111.1 hypothetical protein B7R22_14010 [Subtercola boreus]
MVRNADATRQRLITAARSEFAAYGQAGARVDRIARNSGSNKAQIYHYFGSKEALFDAVWEDFLVTVIGDLELDIDNLAAYAVGLAALYEEFPEFARLVAWQRLEGSDSPPMEISTRSIRRHTDVIGAGQDSGVVATSFEPKIVFSLICHIASLWSDMNPDVRSVVEPSSRLRRLEIIGQAAAQLLGRTSRESVVQ